MEEEGRATPDVRGRRRGVRGCVEGLGGCGDVAVRGTCPECDFETVVNVVEG